MHVIHISFECYPVAKAGGLADVVGALPKYLKSKGVESWVVMPKFNNSWIRNHQLEHVHDGITWLGEEKIEYNIFKEQGDILGFPIYFVDVPGRLDREGIYIDSESDYGYWDDFERYTSFQLASLDWMKSFSKKPDIIHCHDHHTAFVPFLMAGSPVYHEFARIPSVLTIHNGHYQGWYETGKKELLPKTDPDKEGLLFWNGRLNALSAGLRTAWRITTVSHSYLEELQYSSKGLESLLAAERQKSFGILNGIDTDVWDPSSDSLIVHNFDVKQCEKGKEENKKWLCKEFGLNKDLPLYIFIGRLAEEKGADILPDLISRYLHAGLKGSFLILGTGDPGLQHRFESMKSEHVGYFDAAITYNEELAHRMYAGSDFLIMPSRVEPCGLNQLYAMRYGTIPIVRKIGGLKDTVIDFGDPDGYGVTFNHFNIDDTFHALQRSTTLYSDPELLDLLRKRVMEKDFSWYNSAGHYQQMYKDVIKEIPQ
ncbi:glycogen synthase [Balneolaceae bacterium ANBcel3]|nr:glycogen synthase [Balneolaceae bacterium ANBcel3]